MAEEMDKIRVYVLILSGVLLLSCISAASLNIKSVYKTNIKKNDTELLTNNNVWTRSFGGKSRDGCFCVQQTFDGGYILTGYTSPYGIGDFNVWLVKTDGFGNKQWDKTFGGSDWDYASSVQQTMDGGYVLVGKTRLYSHLEDMWLIKTDEYGNMLWNTTFDTGTYEYAFSVQQARDGGYILVGDIFSWGYPVPRIAFWLIKTDEHGNILWDIVYDGEGDCGGNCVRQTLDGGYIVVGDTICYGAGSRDVWLVKTDGNGNEVWNRTFGGESWEEGSYVQQTLDGGYILVGATRSFAVGPDDLWLIKTDEDGNEVWNRTFGGTEDEEGHSVQQTTDGGYIVGGYTLSYGAGYFDFWLIKTDENGNEVWNRTFGGGLYDEGWHVQQTSDGGYILGGHTSSYGAGSDDMWLVKTDENGTVFDGNNRPSKPSKSSGPINGRVGTTYGYTSTTFDQDGDKVYYWFNWDDGTDSGWVGPLDSNVEAHASHSWTVEREYEVMVKAKDEHGKESEWSDFLVITIPKNKPTNPIFLCFLEKRIECFPLLARLLSF